MTIGRSAADTVMARPGLLTAFKVVAGLFALLVLLQAFLAGRGLYLDSDMFDIHSIVGQIAVLVALIQVALAFAVYGRAGLRSPVAYVSIIIFVLTFVQIGLGFTGRDSSGAASWHVLNGVLLFGVSTGYNAMVFRLRR